MRIIHLQSEFIFLSDKQHIPLVRKRKMIRFFTVCNPGGSHYQETVFEQNMSFKPLVCCLLIYLEPNFSNIFNQNNFFSLVTNKRRLVKIKHQPRFASFSRSAELIVAKIFKQTLIISPRLLFSCARSRNLNFPPVRSNSGAKGAQSTDKHESESVFIKVNIAIICNNEIMYSLRHQ